MYKFYDDSDSLTSEEKVSLLSKTDDEDDGKKSAGIRKESFYLSLYVFLYLLFLCSGAALFSFFEVPMEDQTRDHVGKAVLTFRELYPNVSDSDLEALIVEIVKASRRGVLPIGTREPNWSFGQSLFFTSTVVTTIGYGHVTPLSRSGKVFCILYAIVGIPLTLVLLSALVERLLVPTLWLLRWLNSKLGHRYQTFHIRLIHLTIIVIILVVFFLLIPAAVFAYLEPEWDYLDSIYYCFVSLTTIGLGDFIPGDSSSQSYRPLYKILTTVYLFLGITYMMLALAVFYDIPQLNLGLLFTPSDDDLEKVRLATAGQSGYNAISGHVYTTENRQVVIAGSTPEDADTANSPEGHEPPLRKQ